MSASENILPMKPLPSQAQLHEEMATLIVKANQAKPESKDVRELRRFLDQHPELWRDLDVIASSVRSAMVHKTVSGEGHAELLNREYHAHEERLGWREADGLEKLLIERVLLCWMRLLWAENYNAALMGPGHSIKECEFADRTLLLAHNRFLRACEALGRVQRLTGKVERPKKRLNALETTRLLDKLTDKQN